MSKVLKFIVHFVVICTLICVLGLVLPPFFGVRTVIVDKSDKATNLPVGSVTYAIPEKSSAISAGTPILVQKDSETYKYTITNLDASKGTGTVTDQSVSGGKTFTIKVGDYVPKVVVTIGSLAMPSYSAAQLASRVKKAGDAPDIVKDDITKVTLFDYSDIISGDVDDMEE